MAYSEACGYKSSMQDTCRQAVPCGRRTQYLWRDGPEKNIQDQIIEILKGRAT